MDRIHGLLFYAEKSAFISLGLFNSFIYRKQNSVDYNCRNSRINSLRQNNSNKKIKIIKVSFKQRPCNKNHTSIYYRTDKTQEYRQSIVFSVIIMVKFPNYLPCKHSQKSIVSQRCAKEYIL